MKHFLSIKQFCLCILLLLPLSATAYNFMVDGLCYNIEYDGSVIVVPQNIYPGLSTPAYSNLSGNIIIPESVIYNGTSYTVKGININAFFGCSGLTSVTIPNSVTYIGQAAFYNCTGLTSVTIPNSVTSIGDYAFYGCSGLTSVTIPNSVTSIGINPFENCTSLNSIIVDGGNSKYDSCNNCNAIIETESNTLITGCKNTIIPNSVTSIGIYAFYGCSGLTSVTIPNSVTEIGTGAFSGCTGLTSITIPNSVTTIGNLAFRDCSGLTSVTIPNSVTFINDFTFSGCSGLTSVTIPNSVTSIGDYAFRGCTGLTSVTIPNSVTTIGSWAFSGCTGLTSIAIPNSVTTIGSWAFDSCYGLTSITIPSSVTTIGGSAFIYCRGLTSVTIPNSVSSIGSEAFELCNKLSNIYCEILSPLTINENVFSNYNANLYVLPSSVGAYQSTSPWNRFNVLALQPVTGITLSESSHTLNYNGSDTFSFQLTAMTTPSNATPTNVTWTSSNEGVATVSSDGTVTSAGRGTATITATTTDGNYFSASCVVTVLQLATSITLDQQTKSLNVGESFTLTPTVLPENTNDKSVTWSSSDTTVAKVNALGNVTALKRGTATITAITKDGSNLSASCAVTVLQPVTGITLSESSHTLNYNGSDTFSFQLTATTTPSNASNSALQWTSSNENVATVSSDGTVTSAGRGTATIKATTTDGSNLSASCEVTVLQLATEIVLDQQAKTVNVGNSFVLTPTVLPENANNKSVTWSSSDYSIASINPQGKVFTFKQGTATITATTKDGSNLSASCVVTVVQPVTSITLSESSHTLNYNGNDTFSFQLTATTTPSNASNSALQWTSSNENVATVSSDGTVTSAGLGTATITAVTTDGSNLSDSCVVTVNPVQTTSFSIDKSKETVIMGNSVQITGTVDDAAYIKTFNWASSNDAVASVDQNGLVRGVGAGTASITATTIDGSNLSASCIIQVLYPSNAAGAGDVNEDGRIDITDATLIISYLQGNYPMAVLDVALMDVNGDGDINMSDVLKVISLIRNDN